MQDAGGLARPHLPESGARTQSFGLSLRPRLGLPRLPSPGPLALRLATAPRQSVAALGGGSRGSHRASSRGPVGFKFLAGHADAVELPPSLALSADAS